MKASDLRKIVSESPGLKMPDRSYIKSGLITKIHTSDENRDRLAGRKKVLRKHKEL